MGFIEEFPELTIKEQMGHFKLEDLRYTRWTMEELLKDVQKHCLSKQRVKEAIIKCHQEAGGIFMDIETTDEADLMGALLLKELGLNSDWRMRRMGFEEEFPSLEKEHSCGEEAGVMLGYSLDDIRRCCLDKQRVREAIKKLDDKEKFEKAAEFTSKDWLLGTRQALSELKKELGLEGTMFREQFPELVGIPSSQGWVHTSHIELACLSKQRVREAIKKLDDEAKPKSADLFTSEDWLLGARQALSELKKELGMEEK